MAGLVKGAQPPAPGAKAEVIRVKSTEPQTFVVCSDQVQGVWIHWVGRSKECTMEKSGMCPGCDKGQTRKWKGYLHCIRGTGPTQVFLEITPDFTRSMAAQLDGKTALRGLIMRVSKTKGGAKGRYIVDLLERRHNVDTLPAGQDVLPTLLFLWKAGELPSNDEQESL